MYSTCIFSVCVCVCVCVRVCACVCVNHNKLYILYIKSLPILPYRRKRADMIQVFKIMKGIDDIPFDEFFQIAESSQQDAINLYVKTHSR